MKSIILTVLLILFTVLVPGAFLFIYGVLLFVKGEIVFPLVLSIFTSASMWIGFKFLFHECEVK